MRICILGSGALGSAIGGALFASGADVTLISRRKDHVDAINTNGLTLRERGRKRSIRVQATSSSKGLRPADLVVVLVKSFHTREAVENAGPIVGPHTVVVSLQNGLGHEDILAEVVGRERVVGGKTYLGGVLVAPGEVLAGLRDKETIFGELDGHSSERVDRIVEAFNRAGLRATVSINIVGTIWDKLLVNVATGALAAVTRLPYGALYKVPEVRACAMAAVAEGMAVANASGVKISVNDPEEPWLKAALGLPAEFRTSMLQSVEKRARTEIEFINGSVVRWGAKCGVPTPVNQALVACVKGIEYGMRL